MSVHKLDELASIAQDKENIIIIVSKESNDKLINNLYEELKLYNTFSGNGLKNKYIKYPVRSFSRGTKNIHFINAEDIDLNKFEKIFKNPCEV